MDAREREEKLAVLSGLAGNYAAELSPETAKMWLFLLKNYDVAVVQAAAVSVIRRYGSETVPYRTMPPFALMQKELDHVTGAVRGEENVLLQARAEWTRLLELMKSCGSWREPELDGTTAYCVRSFGGWERVCRWKLEELPWRERDFLQLWQQSRGKEDVLALGGAAVKALDAPKGRAALSLEDFRARLTALPGAFRRHEALRSREADAVQNGVVGTCGGRGPGRCRPPRGDESREGAGRKDGLPGEEKGSVVGSGVAFRSKAAGSGRAVGERPGNGR